MWASPEVKGQPANTYALSRSSCGGGVAKAHWASQALCQRCSIGAGS
jgi:hypothetical protein